ncbi:MAG: helix-turn-helix domain-containing protein [Chloroflexota bacterium]
MSPRSARLSAVPAAAALRGRLAVALGTAVREERRRRAWTMREVALRARISLSTVSSVEAGRVVSLDAYARISVALGLPLGVVIQDERHRRRRGGADLVHAAMGEFEVRLLASHGYRVAIDHPYQHYQFAGRADVLAWSLESAALLHIENRTRFPDLQDAAGSFNAKCEYLAPVLAQQLRIPRFRSQTHVIAGLWSAEVLHSVRIRPATFRALGPDTEDRLHAWLQGDPPPSGIVRTFVALDPLARPRQRAFIGLDAVMAGARPRVFGYQEAAARLRSAGRA